MGPPHSASKKVHFSVCYRSGEDKQHPASELNYHSPTTLGWQTEEFCDYPQVRSDKSGNKNLNLGGGVVRVLAISYRVRVRGAGVY